MWSRTQSEIKTLKQQNKNRLEKVKINNKYNKENIV